MNNITFNNKDTFSEIKNIITIYPISTILLNIRSLRKNFHTFLTTIHSVIDQIKIIVLVETNITDDECSFYNIAGFNATFCNRKNKSGGGLVVYIRESFQFTCTPTNTISFESIQVNILMPEKMSLFAIYRPPHLNVNSFVKEMDNLIRSLNRKTNALVVGDMNIDILKENTTTSRYLDMITSNGMQSLINDCTREDINKSTTTCIDHMFLRKREVNSHVHASIIKTTISDHFALSCCISIEEFHHQAKEDITQQTKLCNKKVNSQICETNWSELLSHSNPNDLFNEIYAKFENIYRNATVSKKEKKTHTEAVDEFLFNKRL